MKKLFFVVVISISLLLIGIVKPLKSFAGEVERVPVTQEEVLSFEMPYSDNIDSVTAGDGDKGGVLGTVLAFVALGLGVGVLVFTLSSM